MPNWYWSSNCINASLSEKEQSEYGAFIICKFTEYEYDMYESQVYSDCRHCTYSVDQLDF